jgi:hypothetical protein
MPIDYIIYILIAVLVSIILLSKAKNKAFFGLFLLWLFGSPIILNPRYTISLNFIGIDIQPNRFLFLVLTPVLYIWILTPRRFITQDYSSKVTRLRLYEKLLIGYILIVIFALVINIDSMSLSTVISDITNAITFVVVYFCSKNFINNDDFVFFQIAILTFAAISAIVALYQFFINPEFLRIGVVRSAFSSYYRSNGLFEAEYDQGLFLNMSIIVAMSMNLRRWIKIFFIAIVCAGIFVTMHRLSWVAMIIALGLIWFLYLRKNLLTYILVPLIIFIVGIVAFNLPWSQLAIGRFGSSLIQQRILSDTLSERISQYKYSFYIFREYPLGMGGYFTSSYTQTVHNFGIPLVNINNDPYGDRIALVVHNGFLSAGVKYGILGLILFTLYIFTSIFDYLKYSIQKGKNWYPLFMIMLIFLVFNLTNDFSFLGTQIGVAVAWLIGGFVSVNNPNNIGDIDIQPTIYNSLNNRIITHGN